jgi:hypothetical protein
MKNNPEQINLFQKLQQNNDVNRNIIVDKKGQTSPETIAKIIAEKHQTYKKALKPVSDSRKKLGYRGDYDGNN